MKREGDDLGNEATPKTILSHSPLWFFLLHSVLLRSRGQAWEPSHNLFRNKVMLVSQCTLVKKQMIEPLYQLVTFQCRFIFLQCKPCCSSSRVRFEVVAVQSYSQVAVGLCHSIPAKNKVSMTYKETQIFFISAHTSFLMLLHLLKQHLKHLFFFF